MVLFYVKDVAESLGYANTRDAIKKHVWNRNKGSLNDFATGNDSLPVGRCRPDTVLLCEAGLYQLIFSSRLTIVEAFQQWVFQEVLPSIRKTGLYELPEPKSLWLVDSYCSRHFDSYCRVTPTFSLWMFHAV